MFLNTEAYEIILDTLKPILEKKEMQKRDQEGQEYYSNSDVAVRVVFEEKKNLFQLQRAKAEEGVPQGEWETLSSWLFPPEYGEKDAKSVGNDFSDTLQDALGVKPQGRTGNIELPSKGEPGAVPTPSSLMQKFLTIFPQYKEKYKEHVAQYGECLYVQFFEQYAAPHLRALLREKNAKQLAKYMEFLNEVYTLGNQDAQALVSRVIIGEALDGDVQLKEQVEGYMEEYPYLKQATESMFHYLKRHKKK